MPSLNIALSSRRARRLIAGLLAIGAFGFGEPASAAIGPEPLLAQVVVNGEPVGEPVFALRDENGALYLPAEQLHAARIRTEQLPTAEIDGVAYVRLSGVSGLVAEFREDNQTIELRAEARLFHATQLSLRETAQPVMTRSATGGFVNYDLLAQWASGEASLGGAVEIGLFTPGGGFGTSRFIGTLSTLGFELRRLETSWTADDPGRMRSWRIGDSITRGGPGGAPLRFGGLQFASDFTVRPGYLTFPAAAVEGSAALPSVVDVYVNGVMQGSHAVAQGPFRFMDLPLVTGGGDVQLVVRDGLGRETRVSESYYAAPHMLRAGLHDFSYEIGLLRRNFGRPGDRYGAFLLAGTHRYGLSDAVTPTIRRPSP